MVYYMILLWYIYIRILNHIRLYYIIYYTLSYVLIYYINYIILYYIELYYIILYYNIMWCYIIYNIIILHHIVLYDMILYYIILYRCLKLGTWTHILVVLGTSIYTSWIVSVLKHVFHYRVCIQVWDRPTMLNWIAWNCRFYMMLFQYFKCHCNWYWNNNMFFQYINK